MNRDEAERARVCCAECGRRIAADRLVKNARYCRPRCAYRAAKRRELAARRTDVRYRLPVAAVRRIQATPCAICGAAPPSVVDHDHTSGRVRGPLCAGCNHVLGRAHDDAAVLRAAAAYLDARPPDAPGQLLFPWA